MDTTDESLFSRPAAVRYLSAERRSRTRRALRSMDTNFPVASTVKSFHCSTTTAALPSPKWLRSTRFAAASQSGIESARLIDSRAAQSSKIAPRSRQAQPAPENLLATEHNNFLVIFCDLIKKLPGIQVLHIGLELRLF